MHQNSTVMSTLKHEWENTPSTWVGADPCGGNWEGISCDNSRVISIHLGRNRFSGTIPDELFSSDMTPIHVLLHDNNLTEAFLHLGLVQSLRL
uniref:Leucine-rich repeat-containing N-terminal plant-type domain-containing protein n=1 Tax=Salix viminalis TaxID=40686 RepID=A0A6N2K5Q7_SALVM